MRIVVVGAGALGGLVGAHLCEAGEDVVLVEINKARAKLLSEMGLIISEGQKGERCVPVRVVPTVDGMEPVDLVFISVKSYQTEVAVRGVMPIIGPRTWVLSMQNGIGNTELMAKLLGPDRILCGITYHSVQHMGPNRLRYRVGIKPIQIAPYNGRISPEVEAIGEVFRRSRLKTNVVESIEDTVWQKLLHNAVVNPVSALTGLTCKELLEDSDVQAFMREACMEIISVMRGRGVPIVNEQDPYRPVMDSQRALGKNRPSMWQDLIRGVPTEIDAINGAVVEEGDRLGIKTPLNWGLVRFIRSRERKGSRRKDAAARTLSAVGEKHRSPPIPPMEPRSRLGWMPQGRVPLESAPKLKEMIRDYYQDLDQASRDPKRHVAWCSGLGPVEVLRAMGFTPYFPENHAALMGAGRMASTYISRAVAEGFSPFINTAMSADIGATLMGESPLRAVHGVEGPPEPEVIAYNTNNGLSLLYWFEYHGNRFGVPTLGLHPPPMLDPLDQLDQLDQVDLDTVVQQYLRFISRLEALGGTKMDIDRLAQVVDYSAQASNLWSQILDLACQVPSPISFFDMLIHLAPMVLMRGTPQAVEYYSILLAEIEQRVDREIAAVPNERFRFYWEGPPIWCSLRPLSTLFLENQVSVVASTYTKLFALQGLDRDNPIESMARAYTAIFPNLSFGAKANFLRSEFEKFGVDAVVYHDGRTSLLHNAIRYGLHIRVQEATGLPSLVLEADTHDFRLFSLNQIERQLLEFIELTERVEEVSSP